MRRFWIDADDVKSTQPGFEFRLSEEAFHHAIIVSRLRKGDEFELLSGGPEALKVEITDTQKKSASVKIVSKRVMPVLKEPHVGLAFAVPKWPTLDEVVEKAVELGVHSFQPLISEHSAIKKLADFSENRLERLHKIVQSATVQSNRGSLMQLLAPVSYNQFITNLKSEETCLFSYEGESAQDIRGQLRFEVQKKPKRIWGLVGSEGGWSEGEMVLARSKSCPIVTLGPQILRAETACFAMVSVIKYEADLMS